MNMDKTKLLSISKQPSAVKIMIDHTKLENEGYLKYIGSMITNDATCSRESKSRITMAKTAFNKKKSLFTNKIDLN